MTGLVSFGINQLKLKDVVVNEKRISVYRMVGLVGWVHSLITQSRISAPSQVVAVGYASEDSNSPMGKRKLWWSFTGDEYCATVRNGVNGLCRENKARSLGVWRARIGLITTWSKKPLKRLDVLFGSLPYAHVIRADRSLGRTDRP